MITTCACGARFEQKHVGRPSRWCPSCAADKATLSKAWRLAHPDRVDAYDRRRRKWDGQKWLREERVAADARVVRLAVAMARDA